LDTNDNLLLAHNIKIIPPRINGILNICPIFRIIPASKAS
jgi:hypothetical protein